MAGLPVTSALMDDLKRLGVTFGLAITVGWFCFQLGLPAPYMMGSLFGVWIAGGLMPRLQPFLGIARWFHISVVLGLGVLIGATFHQGLLDHVGQWTMTLMVMIVTTMIVSAIGYLYLSRRKGYDRRMAFLCSIPGGQAEAIVVAREMVEKDYVVALFHLVRVAVVFVSTPLLLAFVEGGSAVRESNIQLNAMPSLFELPGRDLLMFVLLGVTGYLGAKVLRVPMPHLLGPLGLSTLFHLVGWAELPRVNEFVILAQVTIGGGVGARLSKVAVAEVFSYLKTAMVMSVIILAAYLSAAGVIAYLAATDFLAIWLAFVPGGLYEVTLLALVFGFDVAFVAFHHTVRVMLVFISLPMIITRLKP